MKQNRKLCRKNEWGRNYFNKINNHFQSTMVDQCFHPFWLKKIYIWILNNVPGLIYINDFLMNIWKIISPLWSKILLSNVDFQILNFSNEFEIRMAKIYDAFLEFELRIPCAASLKWAKSGIALGNYETKFCLETKDWSKYYWVFLIYAIYYNLLWKIFSFYRIISAAKAVQFRFKMFSVLYLEIFMLLCICTGNTEEEELRHQRSSGFDQGDENNLRVKRQYAGYMGLLAK